MASNWKNMAQAYDDSFGELCAGTVSPLLRSVSTATRPGSWLLDVGTGTGTVALAAASEGWQVDALDSELTMIEYAQENRSHPGIRYAVARLPELPYPDDTFDAATGNFVINHTLEPLSSLAELARVLKTGATVGVTIWPSSISDLNALWNDVIETSGAERPPAAAGLPGGMDFERTPAGFKALISKAGFDTPEVTAVEWTYEITPAALWLAPAAGIGTIGQVYLSQERVTQERMKASFMALTEPMTVEGDLHLPATAILGTGQKN